MTDLGEDEVTEAAAAQAELAVAPELVATGLRDYLASSWVRVRSGESGVLPVVAGLLLISALFQTLNSNFLTSGNLVNLLNIPSSLDFAVMGAVILIGAMADQLFRGRTRPISLRGRR